MARQKQRKYRTPPRTRPRPETGEGSSSQTTPSRVAETPPEGDSSRGSTSHPGEEELDPCPYLAWDPQNPNAEWEGKPVIFPLGPAK